MMTILKFVPGYGTKCLRSGKICFVGIDSLIVPRRSVRRAFCAAFLCLGATGGGNPCRFRGTGLSTCCCPGACLTAGSGVTLTHGDPL